MAAPHGQLGPVKHALRGGDGAQLRPMRTQDVLQCAQILYLAFADVAAAHGFPREFADTAAAAAVIHRRLSDFTTSALVAEKAGEIVGVAFSSSGNDVCSIGPIAIDPKSQASGLGRRLVEQLLAKAHGKTSIRLVQDACNVASLALYTSLGFQVREPLVLMKGTGITPEPTSGFRVREARLEDLKECAALCWSRLHVDRSQELEEHLPKGTSLVCERESQITGYISRRNLGVDAHGVASTNTELQALLERGATSSIRGSYVLLSARNAEVLRWSLERGFRAIKPMTLMSVGQYREPTGPYFPSILF